MMILVDKGNRNARRIPRPYDRRTASDMTTQRHRSHSHPMHSIWLASTLLASVGFWGAAPRALLPSCLAATATTRGSIFGTTYSLHVCSSQPTIAIASLDAAVNQRLAEIDRRMSTWRDDSDVSRFNQAAENVWVPVHQETAIVTELAKAISEDSNGMFDPTVGPLVGLWHFGASAATSFTAPDDQQVAATLLRIGCNKLRVRTDPPALMKTVAGVEIDLSAIAKGYAVDAVAKLLTEAAFDDFMIEIGGEVRAHGANQNGAPWRIGIEAPDPGQRRIDSVVALTNASLATSGDYRNFHEHSGSTFSHTIDPKTGYPVQHRLAAVTVIADACAQADALATAILTMGPEAGRKWAEARDIKAMFLLRSAEGRVTRTQTTGFPALLAVTIDGQKRQRGDSTFRKGLAILIATAVIFGIAFLAMSVGTLLSNRPLQGSCGGLAGMSDSDGKTLCQLCTRPSSDCTGLPDIDTDTDTDADRRDAGRGVK